MPFDMLSSPVTFLHHMLGHNLPNEALLTDYNQWWRDEGDAISSAVDRAGTPHLRMFDAAGQRVDEVVYPARHAGMIRQSYKAGAVWRYMVEDAMLTPFLLGYVTSFYDTGASYSHLGSFCTAHIVDKYAPRPLRARLLPKLAAQDDSVWQGATWMTEAGDGSDLGASVKTVARLHGDQWRLTGDKFFCANVGAELALVAARPEGAADGVKGLALFLVPRRREDGTLNYTVPRLDNRIGAHAVPTGDVELRDSEAWLMGEADQGYDLVMEVHNLSRAGRSMSAVALTQRALLDADAFVSQHDARGKLILSQPLISKQFIDRVVMLQTAFALAWEAVYLANVTSREVVGIYSNTYTVYRLVTHLAKYLTAQVAVDTVRWTMQLYGGSGVLAESGLDRWLRDAMILETWDESPQRQMLDGLDVIRREEADRLLFNHFDSRKFRKMADKIDHFLAIQADEDELDFDAMQEAEVEHIFPDLAQATGRVLLDRLGYATRLTWLSK